MIISEPYATHLELLLEACGRTKGDIVELGCGYASTPLLGALAFASRRKVWTIENDAVWFKRFSRIAHAYHTITYCDTADWLSDLWFQRTNVPKSPDVLLVDSKPHEERLAHALRFAPVALIVHDTQPGSPMDEEKLRKAFPGAYLKTDQSHDGLPWTTLVQTRLKAV